MSWTRPTSANIWLRLSPVGGCPRTNAGPFHTLPASRKMPMVTKSRCASACTLMRNASSPGFPASLHVRVAPPEREANGGWLAYLEWLAEHPVAVFSHGRGTASGSNVLTALGEVGGAFLQRDEKAVHALIESAAYPLVLRRKCGCSFPSVPTAAYRLFGPMGRDRQMPDERRRPERGRRALVPLPRDRGVLREYGTLRIAFIATHTRLSPSCRARADVVWPRQEDRANGGDCARISLGRVDPRCVECIYV